MRSDLNVPLDKDGKITDPVRIRDGAYDEGAVGRRGRSSSPPTWAGPGRPAPEVSLAPAPGAGEQLGSGPAGRRRVGPDAMARAEGMTDGDILLLENIRFHPAREQGRLATGGTRETVVELVGETSFVTDGFGVVHREQVSV